jgi:hypothetical protein
MKPYLAKFTILEGEHEHYHAFLLYAHNHDEATRLAKSQEHEPAIPDDDDEELTYWDYGDGTTSATLDGVVEITRREAATLSRLGIVHYFNQEPIHQQKQAGRKSEHIIDAIATYICVKAHEDDLFTKDVDTSQLAGLFGASAQEEQEARVRAREILKDFIE